MNIKTNSIEIKAEHMSVSVSIPEGTSLDDLLGMVGGMIKTLGYNFDGRLDFVEEED